MSNHSWFIYSILATSCFGVASALYKLPSVKKQSKIVVTFWFLFTALIASLISFYSYLGLTTTKMVIFGALVGIVFSAFAFLQMQALKYVDTNILFPIITTLSLVGAVIVGLLFFNDSLSLLQLLGVVLVIVVVFSFLYKSGRLKYSSPVILIGLGIIFLSILNKVLRKLAADNFDIHAFLIYQYLFAVISSFLLFLAVYRKKWSRKIVFSGVSTGILIGIINFLGSYLFLVALTKGPFTLITAIHSLYIIVVVIVGYILYKEDINLKKIILILLAIAAILLIRLG